MASWVPVTPQLGLQPIADTSTTQNHPLGKVIKAKHADNGEGEFIYLKGVASTAVGSWVAFFPDDWTTALLDTDNSPKQSVAVAMSANVASQYGWYQIYGKASAVAGTVADNGDVYATSTAGTADDAVVDGYMIHCARWASADSGGVADVEIQYPYTDGVAAND
jgi:hypothetical protein